MLLASGVKLSVLGLEWRGQLADLGDTWANNARARMWVKLALGAAAFVILLTVVIDVARFLDLHHWRARFLSLSSDRSLSELVMDALALAAACLTFMLFRRTGLRAFLFIAAVLVVVALDDFFSLHEGFGLLFSELQLLDEGALKAQAIGELVFFAILGICVFPLFVWSVWPPTPANLAVFATYGVVFCVLLFFAVGVDVIHSLVENSVLDRLLGWVEDGGEIVAIAMMTSVAILQFHGKRFA